MLHQPLSLRFARHIQRPPGAYGVLVGGPAQPVDVKKIDVGRIEAFQALLQLGSPHFRFGRLFVVDVDLGRQVDFRTIVPLDRLAYGHFTCAININVSAVDVIDPVVESITQQRHRFLQVDGSVC